MGENGAIEHIDTVVIGAGQAGPVGRLPPRSSAACRS